MLNIEKKYCKICNAQATSVFNYPDGSVSMNLCTIHFNKIYQYYVSLAKEINSNTSTLTLSKLITQLTNYMKGLK